MTRVLFLVVALMLPPALVQAQDCGAPAPLDDGWTRASPAEAGLDADLLCGIAAYLGRTRYNVHGVVVVRRGKLVFEQYFDGYDDPWGEPEGQYKYDAAAKHDMRSVSKSAVSLLVGIAIERKLIAGELAPVAGFFPDYAAVMAPEWSRATVGDLLTMSPGIAWDEALPWNDPRNDEPHLGRDADPLMYVLAKPFVAAPGAVWTYNGGATDLLGEILARASGMKFEDFARDALFAPLGISDWAWKSYVNGRPSPAAGLRLRPRDAAKLGQLVLDKGMWNGKRVVDAAWIARATAPHHQALGFFGGLYYYGYQWWLGRTLAAGKDVTWIAAMGLGGQRVFAIPERDMVVVLTAGMYGSARQNNPGLDILHRFAIPAAR